MYFIGVILVILIRAYIAGANSDQFLSTRSYSIGKYDEGTIMAFIFFTMLGAATWPVSIPAYVVFKIGQRKKG